MLRHSDLGRQPRRSVHRGEPAPLGAIGNVAAKEDRRQERLGCVDRRLQLGRSLAVSAQLRAQRRVVRREVARIRVDVADFRWPRDLPLGIAGRDLVPLRTVARAHPFPCPGIAVAEGEELDAGHSGFITHRRAVAATIGRAKLSRLSDVPIASPALIYAVGVIIALMFDPADAPGPDLVYVNYLRTCAMLDIEPTPRDQALGLIQEWTEVLTGRPEPTMH
jgi:hypothetical protein